MRSLAMSSVDVRVRSLLMPRMQRLQMSMAGRWFLDGVRVDMAMRLRCCCAEYASGLRKKIGLACRMCGCCGKRARSKRRECCYLC
jgi:hypothetical protein